MTPNKQQRGSTLLVALVMLVLLTLIALSAMKSTTSGIQVVGNAQFREEAKAAAQKAIEKVLSTADFKTTPPAQQSIDVNGDGAADYTVAFFDPADPAGTAPRCLSSRAVAPADAGVPPECAGGIGGQAACYWTTWDIRAVVSDIQTGAGVVLHQGVKTIAGLPTVLAAGC